MRTLKALLVFALLAGNVFAGSVSLSWVVSPSPGVTHTRIHWGGASGSYTNFVSVPMPGNTVTITNLTPGVRYWFVAIATDGEDDAIPSNEVNAKLKPAPAKNLAVTATASP